MKRLALILRGPSGSGKSTFARAILSLCAEAIVCSADDFFLDAAGVYRFDPRLLGAAHATCFRRWVEAISPPFGRTPPLVVCDNTSATDTEIHPYALAADAFGVEVLVVNFIVSPSRAFARAQHGAPLGAIERQYDQCRKVLSFGRYELRLVEPSHTEAEALAARIVRGVSEGKVTW